jgi:hypothetical protein
MQEGCFNLFFNIQICNYFQVISGENLGADENVWIFEFLADPPRWVLEKPFH